MDGLRWMHGWMNDSWMDYDGWMDYDAWMDEWVTDGWIMMAGCMDG